MTVETCSIQVWPRGASYTFRGNVHAPTIDVKDGDIWRIATPEEHRAIKIEVLAEQYGARDILCCDSILVDELLRLEGESNSELAQAFGIEEIRNLYADPSEWTIEQCREYIREHWLKEPDPNPWTMDRSDVIAELASVSIDCSDDDSTETLREALAENINDETLDGIDEWREVCREHAQENPAEPYEWWRVSSWLCGQLHAIGEVTIDNGYGYWWGRQTTGQQWIMDGVLQRVAERFVEVC